MKRLLQSVDRWGPAAVAILAIIIVIIYINVERAERKRLEGMVESRIQMEIALRTETQVWQAYVIVLRSRMVESNIKGIPDPPPSINLEQICRDYQARSRVDRPREISVHKSRKK